MKLVKVQELRDLASKTNHALFAFLQTRINSEPIDMNRFLTGTRKKMSRIEIVEALKAMDNMNLGNFVAGRRTFPSRFIFYATPKSVADVALGDASHLVRAEIEFPVETPKKKPGHSMSLHSSEKTETHERRKTA